MGTISAKAGSRAKWLSQASERLPFVWGKCRNVYESRDLWVRARFGYDSTAIGMTDQQHRAILSVNKFGV